MLAFILRLAYPQLLFSLSPSLCPSVVMESAVWRRPLSYQKKTLSCNTYDKINSNEEASEWMEMYLWHPCTSKRNPVPSWTLWISHEWYYSDVSMRMSIMLYIDMAFHWLEQSYPQFTKWLCVLGRPLSGSALQLIHTDIRWWCGLVSTLSFLLSLIHFSFIYLSRHLDHKK